MPVRLLLFGPPALEHHGETIALAPERRFQLLAYLALRGTWVGRPEIATRLWPDLGQAQAYANLRKTLFRLHSLPWPVEVRSEGGALHFEAGTDVADFEAALREGRVEAALALRRGELLAGFDDDGNEAWTEWLRLERDRIRAAWRRAALDHVASDLPAATRAEVAARLLELDPLDEAALAAYLRALAEDGQAGRARRAYREYAEALARELAVAPSAEIQALHDALAGPEAPRAVATAAPRDEGFVGRSVELRQLAEVLAKPDCRLVTITGPGGMGKTRLARQAMAAHAGEYRDGVAFVALEDVVTAQEAAVRLGRALEVPLASRADPLDTVLGMLREREALVVLDNFEQLAGDAAVLERLLAECPRVRLLVTSRVRLGIAPEWIFPLEGLPCPEPEDQDRWEAFDAARLFVRAARRASPGLDLSREAGAVVEICRAVEGLPLALELAASWTRVLSCEAIVAELARGTDLLTAVDPARPARHASIEAVFEHSLALLGPAERTALARLSVFRGGFTPEAARSVARASLPVLASLADKSLLRREAGRIHMHPLLQQLAMHRFAGDPERAASERAHAGYFMHELTRLRPAVADGDRAAMHWIDAEIDNLRAAWNASVAHRDADAIARGAWTLLHYFDHRGRAGRCIGIFREALSSGLAETGAAVRAVLESACAHLEYRLDRYPEAHAAALAALEVAHRAREHDATLQCHKVLGGASYRLGRLDEAREHYEQALRLAPPETDPQHAAGMLDNLALVEKASGRLDEALRLSLESLLQHRRVGDRAGEALCLNNLGSLYIARREPEAARPHLEAALPICEHHGFAATRVLVLANLMDAAALLGDLASAERHARQAIELAAAAANRAVLAYLRIASSRHATSRGRLEEARSELAAGLDLALVVGRLPLQLDGLGAFADLLEAQGEAGCARQVIALVAAHPATPGPERAEMRARLAASPAPVAQPPLALDELARRIVAEAPLAHAPLIEALR